MKIKIAFQDQNLDAGSPYVRFDEGEVASTKPLHGLPLCNPEQRKARWVTAMKLLALITLVDSSTPLFGGITVEGGVLKLAIDEGTTHVDDIAISSLGAFSSIEKTGNGTAVLAGDSFKSFEGDITVSKGTLGATSLSYFGKGKGTVTVAADAILDLTSESSDKGSFASYRLNISGTIRRDGTSVGGAGLGPFELSGNTVFDMKKGLTVNGGGGKYVLNGHSIQKTGAGKLTLSGGQMTNGTVSVCSGTLELKSTSAGDSFRFIGDADSMVEVKDGSTLSLSQASAKEPSTVKLHFKGSTQNTLEDNSDKSTVVDPQSAYNHWAGPLIVDSPLAVSLPNEYNVITFCGAVTANAPLTFSNVSKGMLVFSGYDGKTFNSGLTLNNAKVEFKGTKSVTFAAETVLSASGSSVISFVDAGDVDMSGTQFPYSVGSDPKAGLVPHVVFKGKSISPGRATVFGNQTGAAIFEIQNGAIVSNMVASGEKDGIATLHVVKDGFWRMGDSNNKVNPNNRNAFGWVGVGGLVFAGGMINVADGKSAMYLGKGLHAEGTVVMSGGEWLSGKVVIAGKGYGCWWQTGGRSDMLDDVYLNDGDGNSCGVLTLSGTGTEMCLTNNAVHGKKIIGCNDTSSVQSIGTLNLNDGAILRANSISKGPNTSAQSRFYVNFDGGIVAPASAWQLFGTGGASSSGTSDNPPDEVTVYSRGAIIDCANAIDGSYGLNSVYVSVPLKAASGKGIAAISIPEDVKALNYACIPHIYIEGDGYGASAVAEFDPDTCHVTGVKITSRGCNYTTENTRVFIGANGLCATRDKRLSDRIECTATLADNSPGGGLVKRGGANTLCLYGDNNYKGVTCCETGVVKFMVSAAHPDGGGLDVWKGATIQLAGDAVAGSVAGSGAINGGNLSGVTNVIARAEDVFADDATPLTLESRSLTLSSDVKVTVSGVWEYAQKHGYATVSDLLAAKLDRARKLVVAQTILGGESMTLEMPGLSAEDTARFALRRLANSISIRQIGRGLVLMVR